MDIREAEYFLAIARHRNISQAAQSLFIAQPSLSRYLSNLEKRLEVVLFQRSGRRLQITYAGERYLSYCLEISAKAEALKQEMERIAAQQKKTVSIGLARSGRHAAFPSVISAFRQQYPDITLHISELLSRDLEAGVQDGTYDLGFVSEPANPYGLVFRQLGTQYVLLAVPYQLTPPELFQPDPGFSQEDLPFSPVDLHRFQELDFILQDERSRMRTTADKLFQNEGFSPKVSIMTQSTADALHFTESGLGCCIVTESYCKSVTAPGTVNFFCVGNPPQTSTYGVIYKRGTEVSAPLKKFIRLYQDTMESRWP